MNKKGVLAACKSFSTKGSFAHRVCQLLAAGEFSGKLSSQQLAELLNDHGGRKIKVHHVAISMEPLIEKGIVNSKAFKKGKQTRRYWFPGWIKRETVEDELDAEAVDSINFFSGKQAWTDANKNFIKLISKLRGGLQIVDPYYGIGTFDALSKFGKKINIKFLTARIGDDDKANYLAFNSNLAKFNKEFSNVQMRKFSKFYELHDRYIIADNALLIIGYGIKDLANKESFVVFLPKQAVKTVLPSIKKAFQLRWKNSRRLKKFDPAKDKY